MTPSKIKILIDPPGLDGWSHLVSNDLDALHIFASKIGYRKHMFSNMTKLVNGVRVSKKRPHYDIRTKDYQKCLDNGAISVSSKEIVEFLIKHYDLF